MPSAGSSRIPRVNELLREELAALISREIKDPRLGGLVSVTEVVTSHDLRSARVYVSVFGTPEEQRGSLAALHSASGFLRRAVAHRVTLRHTPELHFELDSSLAQGDQIMRLLREVTPPAAGQRRPRRVRPAAAGSGDE